MHASIFFFITFQSTDTSYPLIALENAHIASENTCTHTQKEKNL